MSADDYATVQRCNVSALRCCGWGPGTGSSGLQNLREDNTEPGEGCLAAHREWLANSALCLWALRQILHMWLISNIVIICGADMSEALPQDKYCMQSLMASLTVGGGIAGYKEIVLPSKLPAVTCLDHSQAFDMQLLLRPEKMSFWRNLFPLLCGLLTPSWDETFYDDSFALRGGQSKLCSMSSFHSPVRITVLSKMREILDC